MKVILIKDVDTLGQSGQIHEVSAGFARNFLFAKKLAVVATANKIADAAAAAKKRAEVKNNTEANASEHAKNLQGTSVSISKKANEKGSFYEAVSPADVAKALKISTHIAVDPDHVKLTEHIKEAGSYDASVNFGSGHSANITVKAEITS